MTNGRYKKIRRALEKRVSSVEGAPGPSDLVWENVINRTNLGDTWLQLTLQPVTRQPLDVTSRGLQRYDGNFLINVHTVEGNGPLAATELADAIVEEFFAGAVFLAEDATIQVAMLPQDQQQSVEILYSQVSQMATHDSPWYRVPVTIRWKAFSL